jgi:hypothetical protein
VEPSLPAPKVRTLALGRPSSGALLGDPSATNSVTAPALTREPRRLTQILTHGWNEHAQARRVLRQWRHQRQGRHQRSDHDVMVQRGRPRGQITKLKLVKRQMCGLAKLDLLQACLIGERAPKGVPALTLNARLMKLLSRCIAVCGIFQPSMVRVLRERLGRQYEPNKYASERIAVPVASAWSDACSANTIQSYSKFIEVWPTYSWHAEERIRDIRYPHLRKLSSSIFWIVWGTIAFFFLLLMVLSFLGNSKYLG